MAGQRGRPDGSASGGALTPALLETCALVAEAMRDAEDRWWIIASAAVALHGVDPGPIGDIDVLASPRDAVRFADRCGFTLEPGAPSDRFRSALFGRWTAPPLAVDVMADFAIATADGWQAVEPLTRLPVTLPGGIVYVPERQELVALLHAFGRPKDLARAALLAAI